MASTIFVTGGTGQTGSNVCEQLVKRGDRVRALVRNPDEAAALAGIGVELVKGDITDADDVLRAAKGAEAAIHCAALLGGASQDLDDFKAVNMVGTTNVLDAGKAHGMRRVVALSTATFLNLGTGLDFEEAPVLEKPPNDPYTVTKLAAFQEAHRRAAAGEDVLTCHPGAIFGPGLVVERALHRTSFNRVLLAGMRGKIKRYLAFPVTWVAGADVATGSIAALDRGVAGERYLLIGRPEESFTTAAGINRACEIAGSRGQECAQAQKQRQPDYASTRLRAHVLRRRAAVADFLASRNRAAVRVSRSCCHVHRRIAQIRLGSRRSERSDPRCGPAARVSDGGAQTVAFGRGDGGRRVTSHHLPLLRIQRRTDRRSGEA
jgi:dihydroflavonol-4-reductase